MKQVPVYEVAGLAAPVAIAPSHAAAFAAPAAWTGGSRWSMAAATNVAGLDAFDAAKTRARSAPKPST